MSGADDSRLPLGAFAKRALIVAAIAVLVAGVAAFVWAVSDALLVLFVAILFAVLLDGMARLAMRWLHLPHPLALTLALLLIIAILGGIFAFGGFRVANEAPALRRNMQQSIQRIQAQLHGTGVEHKLHEMGVSPANLKPGAPSGNGGAFLSGVFSHVQGYLSTSVEVVADVFIIIVAGIYFAASPPSYIETSLKLVPERRRERLRLVAREVGHGLRRWLLGVFVSMAAVGVVTGIGLTLLHVPLAGLLAIIATLLTFIPYLGTIISMVPALLLALLVSPTTVLYVLLLYLGAHALEGYLVTPMVQSRTVHLMPGWLIMAELVGGLAAGVFGVLVAAPVLVTITIVVQMLYVEDVLGDSMRLLGESRRGFAMRLIAARLRDRARGRRHRGDHRGGD
ncbi:MAG TPA: AI-2E family transporter [Rhodanobacteraceae bacterium]|nr:AI-2E family transporter [Rhodanobacteraceae bacterium]